MPTYVTTPLHNRPRQIVPDTAKLAFAHGKVLPPEKFKISMIPWVIACLLWTFHDDSARNVVNKKPPAVERIYLRQRSSDGSVNKTILKPRLALAERRQYTWDFPGVKFRVAAQLAGSHRQGCKVP